MARNKSIRSRVDAYAKSTYGIESEQLPFNHEDYAVLRHPENGKWFAVAVTVVGIVAAIFLPLTDITDFLYFIGSVFAPMIAIQIADFFVLKQNKETSAFNICNLIIWFVGFVLYRLLMRVDIIVGNTLPDMLITIALCVAVGKMRRKDQE